MSLLIGPLVNTFLSLFIGQCIRYYPLRSDWRVSLKSIIAIYTIAFAVMCTVFIVMRDYFAVDYLGNQIFKGVTGVIPFFIPFFLIKNRFYGNFFLSAVVANYILVIFGAGNYIELTYGGAFAEDFPYMICNAVVLILTIPVLPLLLRALRRLFGLFSGENALMWKFIWIIPVLFVAMCLMSANIFMGENAVTMIFIIARIFLGVGMVITCLLFAGALRHEAKNAELIEHSRMMESQLIMQREQYARLMENSEHEKAVRHDIRHQLAVLKGYEAAGDHENLSKYLDELTGKLPIQETVYCENYEVNTVVNHHIHSVADIDIQFDIKLSIPPGKREKPAMDLCIVIGNLLENAIDACRRMETGERFVRVRSLIQGDYLTLVVENSFDGRWDEKDGVYFSRKYERETDPHVEGIGIASVKSVCAKFDGRLVISINGNVWKSSAVVKM